MNTKIVAESNAEQLWDLIERESAGGGGTRLRHRLSGMVGRANRWLLTAFAMAAIPAVATPVMPMSFDFNAVTLTANQSGTNSTNKLSPSAGGNLAIANYMNLWLGTEGYAGASVAVYGALATGTYAGEGRVLDDTLGTSDGATSVTDTTHHHSGNNDTFIINNNFGVGGAPARDYFTFTFTGFFSYFAAPAISFDWEIFPDVNCPANSSCARNGNTDLHWPDMALLVDGHPAWSVLASPNVNGPQGLGTVSGLDISSLLTNTTGVHTLKFEDWPSEVGIDNFQISGCPSTVPNCIQRSVPEPSSLPLIALALVALALARRHAGREN